MSDFVGGKPAERGGAEAASEDAVEALLLEEPGFFQCGGSGGIGGGRTLVRLNQHLLVVLRSAACIDTVGEFSAVEFGVLGEFLADGHRHVFTGALDNDFDPGLADDITTVVVGFAISTHDERVGAGREVGSDGIKDVHLRHDTRCT